MLKGIYLVRYSFRNLGNFYTAGTILTPEQLDEPTLFRRPRSLITDGKIMYLDFDTNNVEEIAKFAEAKYGIKGLEKQILHMIKPKEVKESLINTNKTEDIKEVKKPLATMKKK